MYHNYYNAAKYISTGDAWATIFILLLIAATALIITEYKIK